MKYYDITKLMNTGAKYMICFGERSNGKTFQALLYGFKEFVKHGSKIAIIRRFREDFKGKRGGAYWDNLVYDGNGHNHIKELTNGKYDTVSYYSGRWYLAYFDEDQQKLINAPEPFAYAFALTEMEHEKGNSYPQVRTVLFDEFMTRGSYLPDEFVLFMNTLSTIIRSRNDVKIIMAANTVSQYCPYWEEFGIDEKVRTMKKGDLAIIKFGDSGLTMGVEYCDSPNIQKDSDVYFAFDNPKLKMITSGAWELDIYPHLLTKHEKTDIIFSYFVIFKEHILQADIILKNNETYTFIHRKTTPIKDEDKDIVFTTEAAHKANYLGRLTRPTTKVGKKIYYYFVDNKVFYADNTVGEIMAHYLDWSNNLVR